MLPIYIFHGSERYVLVQAGTKLGGGDDQLDPAEARAVLEAALRRRDPQLIRELAKVLRIDDEEREDVVAQALARLAKTGSIGSIGSNLVLVRAHQGEVQRVGREAPPELPPPEPPPPEPIEEEEEEEPPAKTTIRVSVFFDGTRNNRENTWERQRAEAAGKKFKKKGSYANGESNVSRLETLWNGDDNFEHTFAVYVEGIGTTSGKGDSLYGMATGLGDTGVKAKVEAGVNEVLRGIRNLPIPSGVIVERIHVDAFGFSRGAAAARHFVHVVLTGEPLQPRIEGLGHPVEEFEVQFVGLFDTVASYGVVHSNDTRDLDLDAIAAAKKVVQLAAAEEHRKNFRLTNIDSAVGAGVGVEIYLPGMHSDIGGGYTKVSNEDDLQILDFDVVFSTDALERRFERERAWLIESGWYRPNEIAEVNFWNELKVTRHGIKNDYNRIPLRHMADFASQTGLIFESPSTAYPVPPDLAAIDTTIDAHVAAAVGGTASTAKHWIDERSEDVRRLRHDYLHFTACYGSVSDAPQFSAGGAMFGRRERIVQAG